MRVRSRQTIQPRISPGGRKSKKNGAFLFALFLFFSVHSVGAVALGQSLPGPVVLARMAPDGSLQLFLRDGSQEEPLPGGEALQGKTWVPFGLRGFPLQGGPVSGPVFELNGDPPRLQVRFDYQLVAYRGSENDDPDPGERGSGLAALGPWGVRILLSSPLDRYRLETDGSFLGPAGRYLALVVRGDQRQEVVLFDLSQDAPSVREIVLPDTVDRVEPLSLSGTTSALFFGARLESGDWALYRAAFQLPLQDGPIAAERVAGPVGELGICPAFAEGAVAFLAGPAKDSLDVFVLGESGPATNVTAAPDKYLEHHPDIPRLAVSGDGRLVAYTLKISGEPETFLHEVQTPGPSGRRQITADAFFNPYIDQESWIFFDAQGGLVFAGGHDPDATDLFRVSIDESPETINLTRTGSGLTPPFLTTGSLTIESVLVTTDDALLVSATGFVGEQPVGLLGISVSTGEFLFEEPGLHDARGFFAVGNDVYFWATQPQGTVGLYRFRSGELSSFGTAPLGTEPSLLAHTGGLAFLLLPGTGLLRIEAGASAPSLLAPVQEGTPTVAIHTTGNHLIFGRPSPAGGGFQYFLLDTSTGKETLLFESSTADAILAFGSFEPPSGEFVRGDSNGDGLVDISDAVATLFYLFIEERPLQCLDAADADDDGRVNITDPIFTLLFLVKDGDPLPSPFPGPGLDPTLDALPCS